MRAFVTGATGLLGNNLVRLLHQHGYEVRALVRSREKAAQLFADLPVTAVEGDMRNVAEFESTLHGCDVLFHTAAYFREYFQPGDHWATLKAINIDGTIALLDAAERHGVSKVIYVGSSGTIGNHSRGGGPSDETTPPDAAAERNLYFRSKVLADREIAAWLETHALPVVTILPGWMWGPGDAAPTTSGQIVLDFLQRKFPGIPPGRSEIVDVRDVAQAMINAVERGRSGERYLVSNRVTSLAEICFTLEGVSGVPAPRWLLPYWFTLSYAYVSQMIARITGGPTVTTVNGVRTLHSRNAISAAKAIAELGAAFRPLEQTLRDEIAWFRAHGYVAAPQHGVSRTQPEQ
jgi:dihydroflavonol-4-reductase